MGLLSILLEATEPNSAVTDWIRWLALIYNDVAGLLMRRHVFRRLREIVAANPKLHRASYFYPYLAGTYAASAVVGVRRHARRDGERDGSLRGLLESIRRNPTLITRARHVDFYRSVGIRRETAEGMFDDLVEPGAPHLDVRHVQADLTALLSAAVGVERYATQRIAHLDKERSSELPPLTELDAALDQLERIVHRYGLLLSMKDVEVMPPLDGAWEGVLMEPWIPPKTSTSS